MNGQGSNKILPIKSLLENLKQESKKQYLQLDNKNAQGNPYQISHISTPQTHREHQIHDNSVASIVRDQKKGISLNKNNDKTHQIPYSSRDPSPTIEQGFNFYVPKRDRNNCERVNRYSNHPQQPFRADFPSDHYEYTNKNNKSEQIIYHHIRPQTKLINKNQDNTLKFAEDFQRESSTLTQKFNSKFQEQTRSFSRFQKMQSQPIFKDELTKIKTELFHKQALLFTKTQELEDKEKIIKELLGRLQSKERKSEKIPAQFIDKIKVMQATIKSQQKQIQSLRLQLDQSKQMYNKYQEDTSTNYALINLKLRQYEAEERQKTLKISQMKEKEKRKYEQQEKTIKILKDVLKEKQQAIIQTKQQLGLNQSKITAMQTALKDKQTQFSKQLDIKERFIRELSAEISDLKTNLRNMEARIRQMIDEELQMKELACKFNQAKLLYKQKEKRNEESLLELKTKISELNQTIYKRQSSLIAYKQKNAELQEKLKKMAPPNRADSPSRMSNSKLIKQNQKLSAIAKDFDKRLYQTIKLNQALNDELIKRELKMINSTYLSRYAIQDF